MKTLFLAGVMLFGLASTMARAEESEGGPEANTLFTEITGVVAQAPVQSAPADAIARNGQSVHVYGTHSSYGTWLFEPQDDSGANN